MEHGAHEGDLEVTITGHEYTVGANYDMNNDGVDDTSAVLTGNGMVDYTDTDGDGRADLMQQLDGHGHVTAAARYETETGQWVEQQPGEHGPVADDSRAPGHPGESDSMVIDTPHGDQPVGPATEDTDGDGRPDTAVVPTGDGSMLVTDMDGDGSADQIVQVAGDGGITVSRHTGGGQWAVVQHTGHGEPQNPAGEAPPVGTDDHTWDLDGRQLAAPPAQPGPADPRSAAGEVDPTSDAVWA